MDGNVTRGAHLADTIWGTIGLIHAPVPDYEAQLSSTMGRFFARLKTDRSVLELE